MANILIVEDDASVRSFTARALQIDGHTVEQADDGDVGLEKVVQKGGGYDLVLSDIRMPAMDGIAMAREIAKDFPNQKILLMTGYAEQRERARDVEKIVVDVVQKPFTLAEIRQAVSKALAS
ncbi:MAG: response regulator [Oricola sp.]